MGPGPSNPGFVTCGTTQCDLTVDVCCLLPTPTCAPITGGATACPLEEYVACDEPEDCPAGQFCGAGTNSPLEALCTTVSYWPRLCKANDDCGDAGGGVYVLSRAATTTRSTCLRAAWIPGARVTLDLCAGWPTGRTRLERLLEEVYAGEPCCEPSGPSPVEAGPPRVSQIDNRQQTLWPRSLFE